MYARVVEYSCTFCSFIKLTEEKYDAMRQLSHTLELEERKKYDGETEGKRNRIQEKEI